MVFTQISEKKGIEKYGERAIAALVKEFKQLNDSAIKGKPVVAHIHPSQILSSEKKKSLNIVTSINEKSDGRIKGIACVD